MITADLGLVSDEQVAFFNLFPENSNLGTICSHLASNISTSELDVFQMNLSPGELPGRGLLL